MDNILHMLGFPFTCRFGFFSWVKHVNNISVNGWKLDLKPVPLACSNNMFNCVNNSKFKLLEGGHFIYLLYVSNNYEWSHFLMF